MGRISVVLLVGGVLLTSVDSFLHGFRLTSAARKFVALQSDADSTNFVSEIILNSSEVTGDIVDATSLPITAEPVEETTTILSNPVTLDPISDTSDELPTDEKLIIGSAIESVVGMVNGTAEVPVPVVAKVLKLASLGPAYPDDTSYMMCGGCKAG